MTLQLNDINKYYGQQHALKSFQLTAKPFEIHGILGFNGCGKTSLFKSIMGLNHIDSGSMCFADENISYKQRKYFGYMPEQRSMFLDLSIQAHIDLITNLKQLNPRDVSQKVSEYAGLLALEDKLRLRIKTLSKGQQQKAQLMFSLLHQPRLLILDEPLNGLDFNSVLVFMNILRKLSSEGVCILISSHQMDFMDELCTHLSILNQGYVIKQGSMKELQAQQGYRIKVNADSAWQAVSHQAISIEEKGSLIELEYANLEQGKEALKQFSDVASVQHLTLQAVSIASFLQE
jgi:ABC-2 type transport system ATP-binding protein